MAAPAAAEDDSSFCPSSDRLVDRYLRAKLDGKFSDLANAAYFFDADVCSARPQELVRHHSMPARVPSRDAGDGLQFYFFSPVRFVGTTLKRRSRTIDGTGEKESWHAEGRPKPVEGSACGGYMTKFSYHVKIGPKVVEKPGWIMTEYSFKDISAGDKVLCKIYKSPRGLGRSTSSSSSCTSSGKSGCKRKATDDLEEATSSTRPRQTNQEKDDAVLFERDLLVLEEMQRSITPELFERDLLVLEEMQRWITPEEEKPRDVTPDPSELFERDLLVLEKPRDVTPDPSELFERDLLVLEEMQRWITPELFERDLLVLEEMQRWITPEEEKPQDAAKTMHDPLTDSNVIHTDDQNCYNCNCERQGSSQHQNLIFVGNAFGSQ